MLTVLFFKGLIIGFSIAAPVGPINVLCARRTLAHGRLAGLASGLGAALADTLFAGAAALGLGFLTGWLMEEQFWLRLVGGIFLIGLGLHGVFAHGPRLQAGRDPTSLIGDLTSTFFLTLTNPITVVSFLAVFAAFNIPKSDHLDANDLSLLAGVFCGSAVWWLLLTTAVSIFRDRFTGNGLIWANHVSGFIITGFGVLALLSAFGLHHV